MFTRNRDLKRVHKALNTHKAPLVRLYRAIRGYSYRDLLTRTTPVEIPPDIFAIALQFFYGGYVWFPDSIPLLQAIANELCHTHQEQKLNILRSRITVSLVLGQIFLHGDLEAFSLAIRFTRQHHTSIWTQPYICEHAAEFEEYFIRPVTEEAVRKSKLLLENIDLLLQDDLFCIFRIMVKNNYYPITGIFKTSKDLEKLIHNTVDYFDKDNRQRDLISLLQLILDSYPNLESGVDVSYLFDYAIINHKKVIANYLLERYPEICISEWAEIHLQQEHPIGFLQITPVALRE